MAASNEIEKSMADLEKQIAWLEEQRQTLTFSSPEEEAEADRALNDLKLRYADTVASYRRSQSSRSPRPTSTGKTSPWLYVLLGVVVIGLLCVLGFGINTILRSSAPSVVPTPAGVTNEQVMQACMDSLEQSFPGRCFSEWDKEKYIFTAFIADSNIKTVGLSANSGNKDSLESWSDLCASFSELSGAMQQKFKDAGYGTSVAVCAVDPANHDTVYIMANNGRLLYDAVND